jgi:hypothetical protein
MEVIATWSGRGPCLCSGEWTLTIDGHDYTNMIPKELRNDCMRTAGVYETWYFGGDSGWEACWETYDDGMDFSEWEQHNPWINDIPAPNELIFEAFQKEDFRQGSCGGCI